MKKSKWFRRLLIAIVLLVGMECFARFYLGLGHLPVYIEDPDFEYIYAPNQDLWRFGNHIVTNEFSMRSAPLSNSDSIRILKIGDSVINGGAHVDQDSLSSTLLEKQLSESFRMPVRVLNISAQSWGPDNAYEYLKKKGDFNADMMVLVFSSHDLHDNMHHKKVVGEHLAWPSDQPFCALTDALSRYAWPAVKRFFGNREDDYDYLLGFDDSKVNPGWLGIIDYCRGKNIPLLVYLHAEQKEVRDGHYNAYGKGIVTLLQKQHVQVIQGVEKIRDASSYRDNIHLNEKGHRELADVLYPFLETWVKDSLIRR